MKKVSLFLVLVMIALMVGGCSVNKGVEENEVGLFLNQGVEITKVYGAGRYTAWGFFDAIKVVNVSALSVDWSDPDLVTKDKQPVGISLWVTFSRDKTEVETMWKEYNTEARNDDALRAQVLGRIPRVAKAVTTQFTLDEMLGIGDSGANEEIGRQIVQQKMFNLLKTELSELYVELKDVGINNIAPDEAYLSLLKEKAAAQVGVEVAIAKTEMLDQQLLQEESQTQIDLEIAKRERLVAQERAKVYETNPGWLRLQIWEAAKEVFGGDNVWFIDPNADLTLLFGGGNGVTPLTQD